MGVFVPRTCARRSSLGSLHRGRWAGCSSFGGLGRCGLLFSAPPMCRAGWSRSPGGWGRGWLLSGGDLKPPGPIGPPPASGGLAPPMRRRRCRGGNAGRSTHRTGGRTSLRFRARWCWPCCRFFRSAPHGGAHTEKSNPVRPLGYPPGRRRPGGHAAGSTDAPAPIHPPFPRGERGRGVTGPLRRGRGLLSSHCPPVAPFVAHHDIRVSLPRQGPQKIFPWKFFAFPLDPAAPRGCVGHAERQNQNRKEKPLNEKLR